MAERKINLWQCLYSGIEYDYESETGLNPFVPGFNDVITLELLAWAVSKNKQIASKSTAESIRKWYDIEIAPMLVKHAPTVREMFCRQLRVYFVRDYKFFFNKSNKKKQTDFLINVDEISREKTGGVPPIVFNDVQAFMLNYEIRKAFDKAVFSSNEKYDCIVYVNERMNATCIRNVITYMRDEYKHCTFDIVVHDADNEFAGKFEKMPGVMTVKSFF